MPRYIDADALRESYRESIEECRKWADEMRESENEEMVIRAEQSLGTFVECSLRAKNAQTIDAVPVVHGKWIYVGARGRIPACRCSICGNVENADWAMISGKVNYCPNCGARMDE